MKKFLLLFAAAALAVCCTRVNQKSVTLSGIQTLESPDGTLTLTFGLSPDGTPMYALAMGKREVVKPYYSDTVYKMLVDSFWEIEDGAFAESQNKS